MKYLLKAIGLSILFIDFIIIWTCQFLWDFHYPPKVTFKSVRKGWNDFIKEWNDTDHGVYW